MGPCAYLSKWSRYATEILINIPSESPSKLSKERMHYFCHALKLNLRSRHSASTSNCSMNRSLEPNMIITFLQQRKDPLFNSTRICKVDDHCRKEHRCDCARTHRTLSMLEQNLKRAVQKGLPGLFPSRKSNVRERY